MTQHWIRLSQYFFQPRDDLCRTALQDRLVNFCFQVLGGIGPEMERSEQRRRTRQVALALCNTRLKREGIDVVRCDIENLINLSQRFREAALADIAVRALGQQVYVPRIEPLG